MNKLDIDIPPLLDMMGIRLSMRYSQAEILWVQSFKPSHPRTIDTKHCPICHPILKKANLYFLHLFQLIPQL